MAFSKNEDVDLKVDMNDKLTETPSNEDFESAITRLSVFYDIIKDADELQYSRAHLPARFQAGNFQGMMGWFTRMCVGGVGMFVEAYIIITTGQIKTIWKSEYPECFTPGHKQNCANNIECLGLFPNTPHNLVPNSNFCTSEGTFPSNVLCNNSDVQALSYTEFAGIMGGMLVIGFTCDIIGRRTAGMVTSSLMFIGICIMSFIYNENVNRQFAIWSSFFAVIGFGVGGEYPLTASGAAERQFVDRIDMTRMDSAERRKTEKILDEVQIARRGENISIVFSMQGIGALFGSCVLMAVIYFGEAGVIHCDDVRSNSSGNDPTALNGIWRVLLFYRAAHYFLAVPLSYT